MKPEPFVHLHLHTGYSMLDGACRVAKVMDFAAQENMPAVAITDHGVMFGAIDFYKAAVKNGIKPIIGCEVYVARGSHKERKTEEAKAGSYHLVLLAADATGYMNLARLVSTAHIDGFYYKPRIDKELLAKHSKGLIGLSACLKGEVPGALSRHDMPSALKAGGEYEDILGKGNFFVEVQNHELKEQKDANSHMHEFTKKSGIPLVATNDVHYIQKAHAAAHDVLLCIQTQAKFSDPDRMRYHTNEFYMKTRKEMEEAVKEFPDSINRTLEIAERCNVTMRFDERHFPTFSVPKGMSEKEYLVKIAHEGITKRYGIANPDKPANARERDIMKRFDYEISVIDGTNFINYFLVVWDFVRFALENNIPVGPGRGSGGGSLAAYVLGITNIDPLRYNLVFERFLNPSRVSPPDFDIDFCQARRGEVIEYVRSKYKPENVAQIVTFGSLGSKTVIRDIGRVLEIDFATCDRLSKLVPDDPKITLAKALEESPEFKKASENDPACRRILTYAMVLEGLPRNTGTHAAGVVIGEKPLIQIVPLSLDKDGQIITQYPKDPLGDIGLLKMDFLGLKTLTVVDEAIKLIEKTSGVRIELDRLPYDDKPTYDLFSRGDTVGVFQLESSGMRDLIRRIGINKIEDLIAMIALYRPGPMRMLQDYVNRKSGKATVTYDHPLLEPILKETYGVMVYQEQVQLAANILAGYSLGEADLLRRAMSKKDKDKMEEERASFVEGCGKTNKIAPKLAAKIFDNIQQFAGYGFNKAHSAGYAIISYQTAYLKANYPAEFMSALLSSEMGNSEKLPVFIAECLEMDLKILPPDVSRSDVRFTPEAKDAIRFGLAGIKNVGEGVSAAMVSERRKNGPFKSLFDICTRLGGQQVNKKVFESLIDCGALDSINPNRSALQAGLEKVVARAAIALKDRRSGQGNLFSALDKQDVSSSDDLPDIPHMPQNQMLAKEKELLGTYMTGHPLTEFLPILQRYQSAGVKELSSMKGGTAVRIGGIISLVEKRIVKKTKENMAILRVEDLDGTVRIVVFPETFKKYSDLIVEESPILITGEVKREDETQPQENKKEAEIVASEICRMPDAPRHYAVRLGVHIPVLTTTDKSLQKIRDILQSHPGATEVVIALQFPSGENVIVQTNPGFNVMPDNKLIKELEHELGENGFHLRVKAPVIVRDRPQSRWSGHTNHPKSP